jgi:hypothetical protein
MVVSAPCSELIAHGLTPVGRYVKERAPVTDVRVLPKLDIVGRVRSMQDGVLQLDDHVEGRPTANPADVYLEADYDNFWWCVEQTIGIDAAKTLRDELPLALATVTHGPSRLKRVRAVFDHLRKHRITLASGLNLRLGPEVRNSGKDSLGFAAEVAPRPLFVFDPTGQRTDTWRERGIDKHGPFDQASFTPKRARIAVICQSQRQGQVDQFLRKLLDGLPQVTVGKGQRARRPYEKGLLRRYALERPELAVFTAKNAVVSSYREAIRTALDVSAERKHDWDLAVVQIDDVFHNLKGDQNPYLVAKSMFMKRGVPVQEVTAEKMNTPNSELVYILNDISLATYAKLGGTPWLIQASQTVAHELVIGLGSYHRGISRIGPRERIVGITTVFSGDGRYLLDSRTTSTPYEQYQQALLDSLRRAVETIRVEQNWKNTDPVRLVFHGFKSFRDEETAAVAELVQGLGLKDVKFAYLHLAEDNPFQVFDEQNPGSPARGGGSKGTYAAERGLIVHLSRSESLMAFTGSNDLKKAGDGLPHPVLLKLHRESTFDDMTYLTRQAFAFASDSWRTFGNAPLPITILYSDVMAKLLRDLEDLSDWDPEAMLGKISRSPWFL